MWSVAGLESQEVEVFAPGTTVSPGTSQAPVDGEPVDGGGVAFTGTVTGRPASEYFLDSLPGATAPTVVERRDRHFCPNG